MRRHGGLITRVYITTNPRARPSCSGTPRSISTQDLLDPRVPLSSPQDAHHDVAASPSTWAPSQQHLESKVGV